jgi:hypothetical protein
MKFFKTRKPFVARNPGGSCRAATTFARAAGTEARDCASVLNIRSTASARRYLSQRDKFRLAAALAVVVPQFVFAATPDSVTGLIPAYGELPPTFWEQYQSAIIVAGFALLAIAFLILRMVLRPKTPVVLPPEVIARRALAKLQGRPEDGKLLSEVSQILRRYVGAAFELPAAEMTTTEFCALLATREKIGPELAQSISDFLRDCDARKFSPVATTSPLNAVDHARELVSRADARLLQLAATQLPQR